MKSRILSLAALFVAPLLIFGCSGSDDPTGPAGPGPNVVDDLVAGLPDFDSVVLNWTAPRNALEYDIRQATAAIDDANWESAIPVGPVPDPGEAGAIEVCRVNGLAEYTGYYFALKFRTGDDQWSALSNVATGYTSTFDSRGRIVFRRNPGGVDDLYMMNPDGSDLVRLTNTPELEHRPRWSRDGSRLTVAMDADPDMQVFLLDPVSREPFQVTNEPLYCIHPAFSPGGTRLVYRTGTGSPGGNDIVIIGTDGTGRMALIEDADPNNYAPDWSPDGTKIAFTGDLFEPRTSSDIYTITLLGQVVARLTTEGGSNPAWSADGTRIAFVSYRSGATDVFVMNADGSNQVSITTGTDIAPSDPRWSPDGTRIVFFAHDGNDYEIWMMDNDGGNLVQITDNGFDDRDPDWSWAE